MHSTSVEPGKITRGCLWALIATTAIALISRLCFLGEPFKNDAGIYIYLGKVLWQHGMLYHDFWDTKLPSVPLLCALLYGLFANHWAYYVLLQAALGIGGAWLLAITMRKQIGAFAFWPALLCGLVLLNISRLTITGFQLETIQSFLEILAASILLRSLNKPTPISALFTGFLAGLAAMPKPTGLAVGGAAAAAYLWQDWQTQRGRGLIRVVLLAIGAAIPILLVAIWVSRQPWRTEIPPLLREIRLYASGTPWRSLLQFKTWIFFLLPFSPLAIRWAITQRSPDVSQPPRAIVIFAITWASLEILAVITQRRLYGYHFEVLTPAAVMLFALWPRSGGLFPIALGVAPAAIISLLSCIHGYQLLAKSPGIMPASRYVIDHTAPSDTVWADPEARLLLETNRPAGSRLQMTFYFVNHDDAPQALSTQMLEDFEQRQPKYIVVPIDWTAEFQQVADQTPGLRWRPQRRAAYLRACSAIKNYVESHYTLEISLDGKLIYRRNFSAP